MEPSHRALISAFPALIAPCRLMESHKKLSRLNQTLEDRLLTVVSRQQMDW